MEEQSALRSYPIATRQTVVRQHINDLLTQIGNPFVIAESDDLSYLELLRLRSLIEHIIKTYPNLTTSTPTTLAGLGLAFI